MRNKWCSIFAFSAGIVVIAMSMFLETLGAHTGFWVVTSVGFTIIAASLVLDGQTGISNPRITQKPTARLRFSQLALAFIRNTRKR